jgi:hypothetical protein
MESQYDSSKESFGDEITGLLVAPAFQPASPDAGSMPASGDLAFGATWHAPSRMFCSDGFGAGLKGFRDFLRLWRGIEPRQRRAGWKAGGPSEPRLRRAGWKAGGPSEPRLRRAGWKAGGPSEPRLRRAGWKAGDPSEPRLRRAGWKAGDPSEPRLRRAGWKAGGPSEPRLRRAGWKAGGPSEPRLRRAGWKAGGPSGIERAESTGVEFSGNFSGDKRRSE